MLVSSTERLDLRMSRTVVRRPSIVVCSALGVCAGRRLKIDLSADTPSCTSAGPEGPGDAVLDASPTAPPRSAAKTTKDFLQIVNLVVIRYRTVIDVS
jgi:hypothetical protein